MSVDTSKLNTMTHWKEASIRSNQYQDATNLDDLKDKLTTANDSIALNNIENMHNMILAEMEYESDIDERVRRIHLGIRIVATINKLNDDNNITGPQLTNIMMDNDLRAILSLLQGGALDSAKDMFNAKDISNLAPMNNTYKTKVTKMIEDYFAN